MINELISMFLDVPGARSAKNVKSREIYCKGWVAKTRATVVPHPCVAPRLAASFFELAHPIVWIDAFRVSGYESAPFTPSAS